MTQAATPLYTYSGDAPEARITLPEMKLKKLKKAGARFTKIALPTLEGYQFEKIKHILFLEAQGNYTNIHFTNNRQILVCKTLREVELMLSHHSAFVRIHRSHTVHLRHVHKYVKGKGGYIILHNGASLNISSGQREEFVHAFQEYFCT